MHCGTTRNEKTITYELDIAERRLSSLNIRSGGYVMKRYELGTLLAVVLGAITLL